MSSRYKIGLLGPFGSGNLGDAAIQEAAIHNIKRYLPDAEICAFSHNPEDTEWRHGITCYALTRKKAQTAAHSAGFFGKLQSIRDKLSNVQQEISFLRNCQKILKSFDLLIMSGGGQLDDFWGGPWGHPSVLLKWSILAKISRTKLAFLSVGADMVASRLSKLFIKIALSLSDYRSFRENKTREFVEALGLRKNNHVRPDLAYSLPVNNKLTSIKYNEDKSLTVGICPIAAGAWTSRDDEFYIQYRNALLAFAKWLVENRRTILFFPSQVSMDTPIVDEIMQDVRRQYPHLSEYVELADVETLDDLMSQISRTDIVVASRLHAVLLSSLMLKPVVAVSYNRKVNILMDDLTCHDYSLDITDTSLESLTKTFESLVANIDSVREILKDKVTLYVRQLDEQYQDVLGLLKSENRR